MIAGTGRGKVRVIRTHPLKRLPERFGAAWGLRPSWEISATIGKGQGGREVEADQHISLRVCLILEPFQRLLTRPCGI